MFIVSSRLYLGTLHVYTYAYYIFTKTMARLHRLMDDERRLSVYSYDSGGSLRQIACGGQSSSTIDWCDSLAAMCVHQLLIIKIDEYSWCDTD